MDVDRRIRGIAYIGRIKDVDSHKGDDEAYAIVYQGKGDMGYALFNSLCSTHNDKFFYGMKVNKKQVFTMRECLEALQNFPMVGTVGLSLVDHPLTFIQFGQLAYEHGILSSSSGCALLSGKAVGDGVGAAGNGDGDAVSGDGAPDDGIDGDVDAVQQKLSVSIPQKKTSALCDKIIKKQNITKMIKSAELQSYDFRIHTVDKGAFTQAEQQLIGLGSVDVKSAVDDVIPVAGEEVIGVVQPGYEGLSMDAMSSV